MESLLVKAQLPEGDKLERLNGLQMLSLKMEYLLTIAKVFYVLSEPCPMETRLRMQTQLKHRKMKLLRR